MRQIILAAAAACITTGVAAQSLSGFPEEQAVLTAALEARGAGRAGRLLIADRTATFACDLPPDAVVQLDGCSGMRPREESPARVLARLRTSLGASDPALADLRAKSMRSVTIDKQFRLPARQVIWGPGAGKSRRHVAAPDLAIAVSRVGFDAQKKQAVAYVATISWKDPAGSFGEYLLLDRRQGNWTVARRLRVWEMRPE